MSPAPPVQQGGQGAQCPNAISPRAGGRVTSIEMNSNSQEIVTKFLIGVLVVAVIAEVNHAPPHTHEPIVEFADLVSPVFNATGIAPTGTGLVALQE